MATQGFASSGGSVKHRFRAESRHGSGFVGSVSFAPRCRTVHIGAEESSRNDGCVRLETLLGRPITADRPDSPKAPQMLGDVAVSDDTPHRNLDDDPHALGERTRPNS